MRIASFHLHPSAFPLFVAAALLGCAGYSLDATGLLAQTPEKKAQNPEEGKTGTTVGVLTAKPQNAIEVKADGEEKARKFVPEWKGGLPKDGGGPDKEILKTFAELKIGSRVEVEWVFHERLRALKIKVLREPTEKK